MVADHPDIAGVWRDPVLLSGLGPLLADPFRQMGVTKVVGPETRGMVLGSLVAVELGAGLVCARKQGRNHPGADILVTSEPTWTDEPQGFQLRSFDLSPTDVVLIVDDSITTGNSIRAIAGAIDGTEASRVGAAVIMDKADPATIEELAVHALVSFDDVMTHHDRG